MAASGTLVAVGGGGGAASTTITATATPAASEVIHLFWLGYGEAAPSLPNGRPGSIPNPFPGSITDSKSGVWAASTGPPTNLAELGYTSAIGNDGGSFSAAPAPLGTWTGGTWRQIQIGSAIRTSGTTLATGDTITVNWDASGGNPNDSVLIAQGLLAVSQTAEAQSQEDFGDVGVQYGTGDIQPQTTVGSNPYEPTLSWSADYGAPSVLPAPNSTAAYVSAFGAYAATGFAPTAKGAVVATHTSGSLFLCVLFAGSVSPGAFFEPGGTFTGTVPVAAGNYQFMQRTATGLQSWHKF